MAKANQVAPSDTKRGRAIIEKRRGEVRYAIYNDMRRKGPLYEPCEGAGYRKHVCDSLHDLNEVLYPRNVFQKLPLNDQLYFFHPINCSLVCRFFHATYGHTSRYREWHLEKVKALYGNDAVRAYIEGVPLKIKTPK